MNHMGMPREIKERLRTYFELRFPQCKSFDEDRILGEISRPLREEVCVHKCRNILSMLQVVEKGEAGLAGAISQARPRNGHVTTTSRPRHDHVTTTSRPRYGQGTAVSRPCYGGVTAVSRPSYGRVPVT